MPQRRNQHGAKSLSSSLQEEELKKNKGGKRGKNCGVAVVKGILWSRSKDCMIFSG